MFNLNCLKLLVNQAVENNLCTYLNEQKNLRSLKSLLPNSLLSNTMTFPLDINNSYKAKC